MAVSYPSSWFDWQNGGCGAIIRRPSKLQLTTGFVEANRERIHFKFDWKTVSLSAFRCRQRSTELVGAAKLGRKEGGSEPTLTADDQDFECCLEPPTAEQGSFT